MQIALEHAARAAALALALATPFALAAPSGGIPASSRTVYKCVVAGKTVYSDEPCLGAQRIDVQPTRGLDAHAGRVQVGRDVQRERNRELFAETVRPITGMSAPQLDVEARRMRLSPGARTACASLDRQLPQIEADERGATPPHRAALQQRLLDARRRHRELGC